MSWESEIEELRRRRELARALGGPENVACQHKEGRLTVRERIERLLDAGSFHETGALAGAATYEDGRTRPILTDWVALAYELEATRLGPKQRGTRP